MINVVAIVLFSMLVLSGCARQTMIFNGKTYTDMAEYARDVHSNWEAILAGITPLPHPVTKRRLLVVCPTRSYYQQSRLAFLQQTSPDATLARVENDPVSNVYYNWYADKARSVERKGIFPKVDVVVTEGLLESQPTDDYDVLMVALALAPGSTDQWYYYSKRNGRQIISTDLGAKSLAAQVTSYLDSIKAAALQ